MTTTFQAVFEGGVLRPTRPLAFSEGEMIDVIVLDSRPKGVPMRAPTPEEEDYGRRLMATTTLAEMYAVMATAPHSPEDDYDLCAALNANRKATGERLLYPEREEGGTP